MVQVLQQIHLFQNTSMKQFQNKKGFSLLETVLYIGLLAIVLPLLTGFFLQFAQRHSVVDFRTRAEHQAAQIFTMLSFELGQANAIDVTNSTFGSTDSVLVFTDTDGLSVTLQNPTSLEQIGGEEQTIRRLQFERDGNMAYFLTDYRAQVPVWNVEAVRNNEGLLTALNITLEIETFDSSTTLFESARTSMQTTIALQPYMS